MALAQIVDIPESRQITLSRDTPTGKANILVFPVSETTVQTTAKQEFPITDKSVEGRGFGSHTGKFWMADDFDEPLEDFKDYM